jgi:hypothetical protein
MCVTTLRHYRCRVWTADKLADARAVADRCTGSLDLVLVEISKGDTGSPPLAESLDLELLAHFRRHRPLSRVYLMADGLPALSTQNGWLIRQYPVLPTPCTAHQLLDVVREVLCTSMLAYKPSYGRWRSYD